MSTIPHSPDFAEALTGALIATGATLAFDAIGGGPLANQILTAMEAAITPGADNLQPLRLERS